MSKSTIDWFHDYVADMIDERGVYPEPGLAVFKDGRRELAAIDDPNSVILWFWDKIANCQAVEVICGVDRYTAPEQGTEFRDVVTCVYWADGLDDKDWAKSFRVGVINYQPEPRIVRPFDFDNTFWTNKMSAELARQRPLHRILIEETDHACRVRS